ncbi:MAG: MFS transporter [Firmicutes bacterium]|nr:MFS transporter [Bacillota bacterium]
MDSQKSNNKPVIIVCLVVFILVIGTGTVAPLIANYAVTMGANGLWIASLFSSFYLIRFLLGVPIGKLGDTKGPKTMLMISLLIYPIAAICYWLSNNLYILLLARMLQGVASVMMLPMAMTYIGNICPDRKESQYLGFYNMSYYLAHSIGPILGGYIAQFYNIKIAFFLLLVMSILSLGTVFLLPEIDNIKKNFSGNQKENTNANDSKPNVNIKNINKYPGILALITFNVIFAILSVFMGSFFTVFVKGQNLGYLSVGIFLAVINFICAILQYPFGKLADRYNKFLLMVISSLMVIVILFILPSIKSFVIILSLIIFLSTSTATLLATSTGLSAVLGKMYNMGYIMGILGAATSLGNIIGPIIQGFIMDRFKIEYTFYSVCCLWVLGLMMFIFFWGKHTKTNITYTQ